MAAANLTKALRTLLLGDEALRGLIASRVYPDAVPQGKPLPAIVYESLTDRRDSTLDGPSSLRHARVQFDCLSPNREEAQRIGHAVERILDGLSGAIPETREGESLLVVVDDCSQDNAYDRTDPAGEGESEPRRRRTIDFEISYQHDAIQPQG